MKILIRLAISFGIVIIVIFALVQASIIRREQLYQNDLASLYNIATQLGFTADDYLNFFRSYAVGIDANFDVLSLLYATDIPVDEFSLRVDALRFRHSYSPEFGGDDFIHYDSPLTALLTMRQKESLNEIVKFNIFNIHHTLQPKGKAWALITSGGKLVNIQYVDTNERGDVWAYDDRVLKGKKIVQVDFTR